jgi:hypothetical protein
MINPNSGVINDGYVRPDDESVESLEVRGIVAKADDACSNSYCLDGYVDQAGSSPDGRESWVDQVPCQVCSPDDYLVDADCGHRVPASQVRSGFVGVTFPMEVSACHVCRHGSDCDCGEGEDQ